VSDCGTNSGCGNSGGIAVRYRTGGVFLADENC
jgi:hypothetical protein